MNIKTGLTSWINLFDEGICSTPECDHPKPYMHTLDKLGKRYYSYCSECQTTREKSYGITGSNKPDDSDLIGLARDLGCTKLAKDKIDPKFNDFGRNLNIALSSKKSWVVFHGQINGTGKSRLAFEVIKAKWIASRRKSPFYDDRIVRDDISLYGFYNVPRVIEDIITAGVDRSNVLNSIISKKCLVLDELGRDSDRGNRSKSTIEYLINSLYDADETVVITTPLNPVEMKDRYDGSTIDRLTEMSEFIKITGKSYRRNNGL